MAAWTVALFATLRLAWVENGLIKALTDFQQSVALWYGATPSPLVYVNASCSGADQMALCLGVTLAYPAAWSRRLIGAATGLVVVLVLNTIRIGTLLSTADSPELFRVLHEYIWPIGLMAAVAAFVVQWIRWTEGSRLPFAPELTRFAAYSGVAFVGYGLALPWLFASSGVVVVGEWVARAGAAIIPGAGTYSQGTLFFTPRGAFAVTPECLLTPLIPVYLAAALAWPASWRRRIGVAALAVPVFLALAVIRLLVLAVPASVVDTPIVFVHGFFQIVLGVVLLVLAARWGARSDGASAPARFGAGVVGALVTIVVLAPWWNSALMAASVVTAGVAPHGLRTLAAPGDPQGTLAVLPVYQLALFTALWLAALGTRAVVAYAWAVLSLVALQVGLLVAVGEFERHAGMATHPLVLRTWAVAAPLLFVGAWTQRVRTSTAPAAAYRAFWNDVGDHFPTLTGAASTDYYRRNEIRLLTEHLPNLAGLTLLKTDLWDEVKNTRILQWAASQGARTYGIDISAPIVSAARREFDGMPLGACRADVRGIPFASDSFDAIYSMGTVEHFPETEAAIGELARVLRPGGRLILGVPNLHDPFLRPLLAWVMQKLGVYGYGDEKAYSRAGLRRMIESAGLEVEAETGILFIPGWLRMADLWAHTQSPWLTGLTGPAVRFFEALDRRFPHLRRHGYLLATVATKKASPLPSTGVEFVVDAHGCDPARLRSRQACERLTERLIADLGLRVVGTPTWHVFPGHAGVTGLVMLAESHVAVHTFPERRFAAINLYCCRSVADWDWETALRDALGASQVVIRTVQRGTGEDALAR